MGNAIAYAALLLWPVVSWTLFVALPFERALIWSILGGYLLLPPETAFDFPMVPPFDKSSIPNLSAFLIVLLAMGRRIPIFAGSPAIRLLLLLFVASPVATTLLNTDPIFIGDAVVPGRPITDAFAQLVRQALLLLPFFLARRFLADEAAQREILLALLIGGLAYSLPMLLEIRLSPQINVWVYGFFPHSFDQQIRFGGFRPVVFLGHGLVVAFFALTAVIAAFGLWRAEGGGAERGGRGNGIGDGIGGRRRGGPPYLLCGGYLLGVLVLCKSVGAIVYAAAALPILILFGRRGQILVAALLAATVVAYPILRGAGLIPVEAMLERAAAIQEERAESLAYRLRNEAQVLAHTQERPVFGWGGGGRNNVLHDPDHPDPDQRVTYAVLDGRWIIVLSIFGWCGYVVEFGLLALPLIMLAWRTRGRSADRISRHVGPIALILGFNIFELLPNSPLTPFTWLLAGAILGHAESLSAARAPARARIETVL